MPLKDTAARHHPFDLVEPVRQSLEPLQADVPCFRTPTLDLSQEGGSAAAPWTMNIGVETQVQGPANALEF